MNIRSLLTESKVAKSEQWRQRWAYRTMVSVACMAFLAMFRPSMLFLTRNGRHNIGPGFAGFVSALGKDRALGGTLINNWTMVYSCFIGCFLSWIVLMIISASKGSSETAPDYVCVFLVFVLVFIIQCIEQPLLGKKFSSSLIPLIFLSLDVDSVPIHAWDYVVDTAIGAGCAMMGNIIPFPIEYSVVSLRERVTYCSYSTTALLTDLFKAWQYQSCFSDPRDFKKLSKIAKSKPLPANLSLLDKSRLQALRKMSTQELTTEPLHKTSNTRHATATGGLSPIVEHKHHDSANAGATSSASGTTTVGAVSRNRRKIGVEIGPAPSSGKRATLVIRKPDKVENKYWRKLRLTLMPLVYLKLCKGDGMGWYFTNNSSGSKFLRLELLYYLREGINDIVNRNVESKYATLSPLRRHLFSKYALFSALLRDALSIISILEEKITAMEQHPELNHIYRAFHNIPAFRSALGKYCMYLCRSLESIGDCLTKCDIDFVHPTNTYNVHMQACVAAVAMLLKARQEFDTAYFECRKQVYYDHKDQKSSLPYTHEDRTNSKSLPLQPDVLLNMNSFLFLSDALCNLIVQFWSPAELAQFQKCVVAAQSVAEDSDDESSADSGSTGNFDADKVPLSERLAEAFNRITADLSVVFVHARLAALDLFPNQMNALAGACPWSSHPLQRATHAKLRAAFSVSISMAIASVYGLYLDRNIPSMAAFTIAFLAGGAVAGATMVTSLNRAAGTVVAAVIAIIVQFALDRAGTSANTYIIQKFVLGIVAVLVQVPATIVRSYPLQGYAGTCASFTICIMLFAPNLNSTAVIDRIIDTFVGVSIYLTVEAMLATTYTENILLSNMRAVFEGVDDRFSGFQKNFKLFKSKTSERAIPSPTPSVDTQAQAPPVRGRARRASLSGADDIVDKLRRQFVLKDLDVEPVNQKIKLQGDLLKYVELEPGLRRPPNMPVHLLAECVELQAQAVKHIQVMYWAVKACADADSDAEIAKHQALYLAIAQLGSSAAPPSMLVDENASGGAGSGQSSVQGWEQGRSHKSERATAAGASARAASPTSSVSSEGTESVSPAEPPAAVAAPDKSSTADTQLVVSTGTVFDSRLVPVINAITSGSTKNTTAGTIFSMPTLQTAPLPAEQSTSVVPSAIPSAVPSITNSGMSSRASSAATLVAPNDAAIAAAAAPKFLLLPLEHSFIEVGQYVSLVISFLKLALHKMNTRPVQEVKPWFGGSSAPVSRNTLRNVSAINFARVAADMDFLSRSIPEGELQAIATDVELLNKLETQQIVALFSKFQAIMEQLRSEVIGGVTTTVVVDGVRVRTPRQNKELKIVNAMVASTIELVTALKGLAVAMSKMQAHRDIRMTQTGETFM